MYKFYSLLGNSITPLALPVLAAKARGRIRIGDRFGNWEPLPPTKWWFHGASMGEVQALLPIMQRIRMSEPLEKQLLTATSPTGLDRGADTADAIRLAPIDSTFCVRRALSKVDARHFVVCETELWPVLLTELMNRRVSCSIVNGRISDYTVQWYRRLGALFAPILSRLTRVHVPSASQAERFLDLGVPDDRILITGNTKYDISPSVASEVERESLRQALFPGVESDMPIIVLASLRPGEEEPWCKAFETKWNEGCKFRVVIAPRHTEKFSYFVERMRSHFPKTAEWSRRDSWESFDHKILVLDVLGKLESVFSCARLSFVGATLVNVGGHNPLEPAMYGSPVCVGPYISNVKDIISDMKAVNGIFEISNASSITSLIGQAMENEETYRAVGIRGQSIWERHRGATDRVACSLLGIGAAP